MKSRAGAFLNAGGVTLASASTPPVTGSGGTTGTTGGAGTTGAGGTSSGSADGAPYNFESSAQGWTIPGAPLTTAASSPARAFAGTKSLAIGVGGTGSATVTVSSPTVAAGAVVTFHVWIPAGSGVASVQPFALQGAAGNWAWTGSWRAIPSLRTNDWNTIQVTVPANAAPLSQLGLEVTTASNWTGTIYLDSVGP